MTRAEACRRARGPLVGAVWAVLALVASDHRATAQAVAAGSCKPVGERSGEVGCRVVA